MDHNVIAAERLFLAQERAAEDACKSAASAAGFDANKSDDCDDGALCCPTCPWKATAENWRHAT